MLNPSTATDTEDDPTIRKCIGWGFSELSATNLFAMRATNPEELIRAISTGTIATATGPENNEYIFKHALGSKLVVCAWGDFGVIAARNRTVETFLRLIRLYCIRKTGNQNPAHPSRGKYTTAPLVYRESQWCP
jgi:hypothetical protein